MVGILSRCVTTDCLYSGFVISGCPARLTVSTEVTRAQEWMLALIWVSEISISLCRREVSMAWLEVVLTPLQIERIDTPFCSALEISCSNIIFPETAGRIFDGSREIFIQRVLIELHFTNSTNSIF
jgi:hypothetical protein